VRLHLLGAGSEGLVEQVRRLGLGDRVEARPPVIHREALAAMRARDAKALAAAIERDIQQGVDHVRQALSES
jgi:DNA-binding GntR family transcriptional regulator